MSNLFPGQFSPLGFQTIALANGTHQGLTVPKNAKMALIQCLKQPVQWRDDGVAPTAADGGGMYMNHSIEPQTFIGNLHTAEFITTQSSGSTLLVSYYG